MPLGKNPGIARVNEPEVKPRRLAKPGKLLGGQKQFPFDGRGQPGQRRPATRFGRQTLHAVGGHQKARPERTPVGHQFHMVGAGMHRFDRAIVQQPGPQLLGFTHQHLIELRPHGHAHHRFGAGSGELQTFALKIQQHIVKGALHHQLRRSRQHAIGPPQNAAAAGLVPRQHSLLQQKHGQSPPGQLRRRRTAGGTGADHRRIITSWFGRIQSNRLRKPVRGWSEFHHWLKSKKAAGLLQRLS